MTHANVKFYNRTQNTMYYLPVTLSLRHVVNALFKSISVNVLPDKCVCRKVDHTITSMNFDALFPEIFFWFAQFCCGFDILFFSTHCHLTQQNNKMHEGNAVLKTWCSFKKKLAPTCPQNTSDVLRLLSLPFSCKITLYINCEHMTTYQQYIDTVVSHR